MKKIVLFTVVLFLSMLSFQANAQNVSINADGSDPDQSAMLDIKADTMGILIPRITKANRPVSPATSLLIYQTDNGPGFYYFDGTSWQKIENFGQLETLIEAETTARENADGDIQDELDATQAGAGLGTDGSYTANTAANYIADATSLQNADDSLDTQIKINTNNIGELQTTAAGLGTMSTQDADAVSITGGSIEGTPIGSTTASTAGFTTLETSSDATVNGDLYVNGAVTKTPAAGGNAYVTGNLNVGTTSKFIGTEGNGTFSGSISAHDATIDDTLHVNNAAAITNKLTAGNIETTGSVTINAIPQNNAASGLTSKVTIDMNTLGFGAALFVASDGNYELANATDSTRMPCVALAIETGTGVKEIIHQGYVRNDSWDWTVGRIIYISTTNGFMTQTFPTETSNQVQIVGYATNPDRIFFNPNFMLIELK